LLESLHIPDNTATADKEPGLRDILAKYPYLSDLKIKLWPKLNHEGSPTPENVTEWKYLKAILFRRVQIQKFINTIKILEKQGYDTHHCTKVIEFIRPFKFAAFDQ
jgi:hypothetical protein